MDLNRGQVHVQENSNISPVPILGGQVKLYNLLKEKVYNMDEVLNDIISDEEKEEEPL